MNSDLNSIWLDWRAKVPTGVPNPSNAYHLALLKELCIAKGIDKDIIDNVMLVMEKDGGGLDDKEKEKAKRKGLVSKGYGNWGPEDGDTTHKAQDGKLVPIGDADDDEEEDKPEPMKIDPEGGFGKEDDEDDGEEDSKKNKQNLLKQDHETTDKQLNMTKTEARAQAKSKKKKDVGAGTPESRAGEAMVHKGLRLLKEGKSIEEIESLFTELVNQEDHILNSKEGKKWVAASISTIKKIDEQIGIENIEDVAWDTDQGREAIGVDVNLETSSDMFVRTKDGRNIGISLKKDGNVFLNNGGWAKQSKKLVESLRGIIPDEDLERLDSAMDLKEYKQDLLDRISDAADRIGVEEIRDAFQRLQNEPETPSVFKGKTQEEYYRILSDPEQLIEKIKTGKLTGNEIKAYTKLLQVYHKDEYDEIRKIDDNLTKRAFDAINASEEAKKGMKKHIIKSMHIAETLGLNEEIREGGVDEFMTLYGIKPDGAVLNEEALITLLGSKFEKTLNETIQEVRNGNATVDDLNEVIEDAIEIDYESGMILFKHENNKKYPLFYMAGRTRGIGAPPTMELAQTPLMAHALKEGTFNTDDWSEKGLERFKKDIKDIYE